MKTGDREKPNPVSIGFDAKRAFYNSSGLGNYSRNLLYSLAEYYPENTYCLFTPKIKSRIILENEEKFRLIKPEGAVLRLIHPLWRRKYMINDIKKQRLDIYHGLSHELPVDIEKTCVKSIVTVHDLIFMKFPRFYRWIDTKIYIQKLIHACRVADRIVAVSKQTRDDLVSYLNLSPDKISVIYQGCSRYFRMDYSKDQLHEIRIKYNLPERYLLYVGTVEERKNLLGIVKAIHISNINIPLIVIGRTVNSYFNSVLNYINAAKIKNIIFADIVLNAELPAVYRNAECLIYPSFFEGFGIPIVEALVSGIPVITSKGGCFAEAGGPGSIYVDPGNPEEIGEAVLKVINSKELRNNMITEGINYASNFKDDVVANAYMKMYRSLLL